MEPTRRDFLGACGLSSLGIALAQESARPDFTLRIAPVTLEIAKGKTVKTIGYNGSVPGPLIRVPEGKTVSVEVSNGSDVPELVHWHGLHIPSAVDGAMEEGTPMVAPHTTRRFTFNASPAGTRWYHTHTTAGRDTRRATYTGQFGFFYIEPRNEAAAWDQEIFLSLKEWEPYLSLMGDEDGGLEVNYKHFSINGHELGAGEPIRVKAGQRAMLRILNASATLHHRIALAGHTFLVTALDGNVLPSPHETSVLEMGPAERIDAIVEMKNPGVWILGAADDHRRSQGTGIVIEYADKTGEPVWLPPSRKPWNYTDFGVSAQSVVQGPEPERIPLVIQKKFAGSRWVDNWTINGKSYPKTDPIHVREHGRYRLVFDNRSDEPHPLHLHRHSFEITRIAGVSTGGVVKDVVVVPAKTQTEVDLVADNPGPTLFHCHQQMHMDFGFMALLQYV